MVAACGVETGDSTAPLFHFVMIKPSHYDDDGYPIQWLRSAIPSNTLACLNALAEDARRRKVLGPDVEIRLHTYDETNRRVRPDRIIDLIRKQGGQSADRPGRRAVQPVSARGRSCAPVPRRPACRSCIGGFHVSGCIAMLPEMPQDMLRSAGARHLASSPAKPRNGRLDEVLRDAWNGTLKPLYNYHGRFAGARRASRRRSCRASTCSARRARCRASISVVAAPINAPFAPSSTCRAARAASARLTISNSIVRENYRAGHQALLHHRRQFRPQSRLGGVVRPPDPAARDGGSRISASPSRSTRCATKSRISSRRPPKPACGAFSSGSRTSILTI